MTLWLIYYLGAGSAVLLFILLRTKFSLERNQNGSISITTLKTANPNDAKEATFEFLMFLSVILLWPLFVAMLVIDLVQSSRNKAAENDEGPKFTAQPELLLEKLPLAEIEAREIVPDPAGAVPRLPFGHLHPAWCSFKEQIQGGDEVWFFRVTAQDAATSARWSQGAEGYALLRDGEIVKEFISTAG